MKSTNVFINTSLEVQLWSKWNYVINTYGLVITKKQIDQVLLLSIGYLWKQLDYKKKVFKNKSMEDMKWCVR
jgi:hypothetical protein